MRFIADGPNIPDELLVARDTGRVIFFCGAGVSYAEANLPSFATLAADVIDRLGAAQDSHARLLFERARSLDPLPGVGGLVATDRVFGLLEQEFEVSDVRGAVAEALQPKPNVNLDAHRTLLDLATANGITRLVTTNFDLLFEACVPNLLSHDPPSLPDPHSDREFRGIVHLHGRVDTAYRRAHSDEFVISSADFGRAYLSAGWATRFIRRLLSRFQVVFVGYTADDPPVQYLLEGLNLRAGTPNKLYAFQGGEQKSAIALWEKRGVEAIAFDSENGFAPLWNTLRAWAERARDSGKWCENVLTRAASGPTELAPHERGQVLHILSIREGARRLISLIQPLGAEWLLVLDPRQRYSTPLRSYTNSESAPSFDPFDSLCVDSDPTPGPADPEDAFRSRDIPTEAVDPFQSNLLDREQGTLRARATVRGNPHEFHTELSRRLEDIALWLRQVAHHPVALWWAAHQDGLHPRVIDSIERALQHDVKRFPHAVLHGWRMLLSAWADQRLESDTERYRIAHRATQEGWSLSLVRELCGLYRPKIIVTPSFQIPHPLKWLADDQQESVVSCSVEYPHPHEAIRIPDEFLSYAVECFRANIDLAVALERENSGTRQVYLTTSRGPDDGVELPDRSFGLTGPLIHFQKLIARLATIDLEAAYRQIRSWPSDDDFVFARLRIWSAGTGLLNADEAGAVLLELSDRAFWGSTHERDLLYALRDRWKEFSTAVRDGLEQRLLTGSFPWSADWGDKREKFKAHDKLSRLHWLISQGVEFSFDVQEIMRSLRQANPEWSERHGDAAADSNAPEVQTIVADNRPDPILATPISEILKRAEELGQPSFWERIERDPFRGLAEKRPSLALAALTFAGRSGEAPPWAWAAFLRVDARRTDPARMLRTIAARLRRLPPTRLRDIAYPVSDWMDRISDRFYGDAPDVLSGLWGAIIEALHLIEVKQQSGRKRSWADDALNAPVGRLFDLLVKDPAKDGLGAGNGFPAHWTARLDDLLDLPGDMRRHALVMLGFQLTWLYTIDPVWTERQVLPFADDCGSDGDALWDGLLWAARVPQKRLFLALKAGLCARSTSQRRRNGNSVLAGFLLFGWKGDARTEERLLTDIEFREILIHADDELRRKILWQLGQWSKETDSHWRGEVLPFLRRVWPKQRAVHTPNMSGHLAKLALDSGNLMQEVVAQIVPRLGPARNPHLYFASSSDGSDPPPWRAYPAATLDLLWAILGEDIASWPYGIEEVLNTLSQATETASDPRLAELRRRMALS
ncbi:SIR2 family protein [Rhodoplanes elegans]|nr:SIR2 family protein [Rhodoplanes elegans]